MKIFESIKKIIPRSQKKGTEIICNVHLENEEDIKIFTLGLMDFKRKMKNQNKNIRLYINFLKRES